MNDINYCKRKLQKISDEWATSHPEQKTKDLVDAVEVLTSIVERMAKANEI